MQSNILKLKFRKSRPSYHFGERLNTTEVDKLQNFLEKKEKKRFAREKLPNRRISLIYQNKKQARFQCWNELSRIYIDIKKL